MQCDHGVSTLAQQGSNTDHYQAHCLVPCTEEHVRYIADSQKYTSNTMDQLAKPTLQQGQLPQKLIDTDQRHVASTTALASQKQALARTCMVTTYRACMKTIKVRESTGGEPACSTDSCDINGCQNSQRHACIDLFHQMRCWWMVLASPRCVRLQEISVFKKAVKRVYVPQKAYLGFRWEHTNLPTTCRTQESYM